MGMWKGKKGASTLGVGAYGLEKSNGGGVTPLLISPCGALGNLGSRRWVCIYCHKERAPARRTALPMFPPAETIAHLR